MVLHETMNYEENFPECSGRGFFPAEMPLDCVENALKADDVLPAPLFIFSDDDDEEEDIDEDDSFDDMEEDFDDDDDDDYDDDGDYDDFDE